MNIPLAVSQILRETVFGDERSNLKSCLVAASDRSIQKMLDLL